MREGADLSGPYKANTPQCAAQCKIKAISLALETPPGPPWQAQQTPLETAAIALELSPLRLFSIALPTLKVLTSMADGW
jgi:hypothetical protein